MQDSSFSGTTKTAIFHPSNPWDSAEDSDHGSNSLTSLGSVRASAGSISTSNNNVQSLQKQFQHFNNIIASTSHESLPQFPSSENLPNSETSSFIPKPVVSVEEDPWSAASHTSFVSNSNPAGTERTSASSASFTMPEEYATTLPPPNSGAPLVRAQLPRLKEYSKLDLIKIEISNETKSLFGPVIYRITSTIVHTGDPVMRRYSDFLWLQDILLKRYPYRIVTSLPPKKAVGAGPLFLERRRRGLGRFLNFIANHPVLSLDDIYVTFMTYTSSIQDYKSTAQLHLDEEFLTAQITPTIVESIPVVFDEHLMTFKVKAHMEVVCSLLSILEKMLQRLGDSSADFTQAASLLEKASRKSYCIISDCDKCFEFEANSDEVVDAIVTVAKSYQDQVVELSGNLVDCLKSYRDALAGFQLLLSRREIAIPALSLVPIYRRIAANKNKLVELTAKGVNQKEIDRVNSSINQDEREIEYNTAKIKFIRYCLFHEFDFIHSSKRLVIQFIQDCSKSQILFCSENLQAWTLLLSVFGDSL